jgi:hypothetical protein
MLSAVLDHISGLDIVVLLKVSMSLLYLCERMQDNASVV